MIVTEAPKKKRGRPPKPENAGKPAKSRAASPGKTSVKRDERGRWLEVPPTAWKPGQSGNPAGRPRSTTEMKQKAAAYTDTAIEVFQLAAELTRLRMRAAVDMLSDPSRRGMLTPTELDSLGRVIDPAGLAAASHLLDRGHGKPKPPEPDKRHNAFEGMDDDQLAEWIIREAPGVVAAIADRRKK